MGKTLKELNIRAKLGVNIIAVESGKVTNVSPSADYLIQAGDIMVVLGDNYSLEAVQQLRLHKELFPGRILCCSR